MSLPYERLPIRTPLDIYTSADINLLQTNIDAIVGDVVPANTIKGLNSSINTFNSGLDAEIVARTLADLTLIPFTMFGTSSGVATLTSTGLLSPSQIPPITITDTYVVNSSTGMLALDAQVGDVAIRTDISKTFILAESPPTVLANWIEVLSPPADVKTVDGRIGYVTLSDLYAPSLGKFILQTSNVLIPDAQILAELNTGLLKNLTSTGVLSIATPGTDYITGSAGVGNLTASLPIQISHGTNAVVGTGTSITIGTATTTSTGVVQLTNNYSGSSEVLATTEKAVNDGLATKQDSLIIGDLLTSTGLSVSNGTDAVIGTNTTIGIASGYHLPTTSDQTNWNNKQDNLNPGNFTTSTGLLVSGGTGSTVTSTGVKITIDSGYYLPTTSDKSTWNAKQNALSFGGITTSTGLAVSGLNTGAVIGSGVKVGIASGYYLPTTSDESNWNGKENAFTKGNLTTSTGLVISGGTNAVIGTGTSIKPDTGYFIPTTIEKSNWDTAYSDAHIHANATNLNNINQNLGTSYSPSFAGLTVGTSTGIVKSTSGVLSVNGTTGSGLSVLNNSPVLITPTSDDITLTNLNRNFVTYGTDTKLFTGIPWDERLKFKIAVTYSAPNVNVSLTFNNPYTSFSYYINGKKYTVTDLTPFTNKTATAAEGTWFVYINSSNVFTLTQTVWLIYNPDVLLWDFYFNATAGSITWVGEERHTAGRDIYQHARNHAEGAMYKSGFAISQYNGLTTYSSNTDNNFGRAMAQVSGGSFFDEDILNTIAHSDSAISSTTDSPDNDWNLNVNQFLGFTALATAGTNSTTIVFTTPHTLITGQAVCVMAGNTTTERGTTTITTGGTGTSFTVTSVTGLASGDAIVISGRIPIYYISSSAPYVWRKLQSTSFLGVTTQASTWTRSTATITVTFTNHGLQTGDYIFVTVSSDTGAIPLNKYTVTRTGANTFTFTGVATGAASGTLTYDNAYNSTTIPNGVAQFNNAAGGFSAITSTRYYPIYLVATNLTSEPVIAILGQGQSTNATLATALGETPFQFQNLLGLSSLSIQETVPIYRLTYQYSSAAGFNNSRIRLVDSTYINIRVATTSGTINNPSVSTLPAASITTDVSNFNGILTASETTAQSALDRIDDYAAPKANPVFTGSITIPAWITSTGYLINQIVINSNIQYKCLVNHTAGTFVTDLANGDWVAISGSGSGGGGDNNFTLMLMGA